MTRKQKKNLIRIIGAILAICMLGIAGAFAQDGTDLQTRLENAPDFRFDHHKNGIGYGTCPVYTAPYEDALRLADGKAAVLIEEKDLTEERLRQAVLSLSEDRGACEEMRRQIAAFAREDAGILIYKEIVSLLRRRRVIVSEQD
jgi:hypothetical protein